MIGAEDVRSCVGPDRTHWPLMEQGLTELRAAGWITSKKHEAAQGAIDDILSALDTIREAIEAETHATVSSHTIRQAQLTARPSWLVDHCGGGSCPRLTLALWKRIGFARL